MQNSYFSFIFLRCGHNNSSVNSTIHVMPSS